MAEMKAEDNIPTVPEDPAVYKACLDQAKADYERLAPVAKKIQETMMHLRQVIRATSGLLQLPVEEEYLFGKTAPASQWPAKQRHRGP